MNQYGKTAVKAYEYYIDGMSLDDAWKKASLEVIGTDSGRTKSCPKNTFRGLYDGNYNSINAKHGRDAVKILMENPKKSYTKAELWALVTNNSGKNPNSQMDVVLALWEYGYIDTIYLDR